MKSNVKILKKIMIMFLAIVLVLSVKAPMFSNADTGLSVEFSKFDDDSSMPKEVNNLATKSSGTTIAVLRIVGVAIAVVMLLVIAMRYMIAAPGDRADIKKNAINYVIGAFVLFGVTGIIGILVDLAGAFGDGSK